MQKYFDVPHLNKKLPFWGLFFSCRGQKTLKSVFLDTLYTLYVNGLKILGGHEIQGQILAMLNINYWIRNTNCGYRYKYEYYMKIAKYEIIKFLINLFLSLVGQMGDTGCSLNVVFFP